MSKGSMNNVPIALCAVVLLVSVLFLYDRLTRRIPSRLQTGQAPRSEFGLVPVADLTPSSAATRSGVDIVFVHGLGSNPDTTWRVKKTRTSSDGGAANSKTKTKDDADLCWVTDFLPQDIASKGRGDVRIFFYNYDTYWKRDAVHTRLSNLGLALLDLLTTEIRHTVEERERDLVFVGHSYGGLIIKQALVQGYRIRHFTNIPEHTKAVFFLGTPHRGSRFSRFGVMFATAIRPLGSNPSILGDLAYDSISLFELHRSFVDATGDSLMVFNFFEERPTRVLKLLFYQFESFVVKEESATYSASNVRNVGLSVDHANLNKFNSKCANYKSILSKLLAMIEPSTAARQRRFFSVPLRIVPTYTDRQMLSQKIEEKLEQHHQSSDIPYALAIYGLGGTGKTQLARKYVEDHKNSYSTVLWIDAKDEGTIRSSFERCASDLRLSVDKTSSQGLPLCDSEAVREVLKWLIDRTTPEENWLVIVDNADDFTWGVRNFIPRGAQGTLIITSQNDLSPKLVPGNCEKLRVDVLEPAEARALLLHHLGSDCGSATQTVKSLCDRVAACLDFLALAIDLAGAYIGSNPNQIEALEQYLVDLGKHQDELLQRNDFCGLSAYDKTVWTVWDTILVKIDRMYPDQQPSLLLTLLAHFDGGVIHDEIFCLASPRLFYVMDQLNLGDSNIPGWLKNIAKSDGGTWDSYQYRATLEPLVRYHLLQRVDGEWPGVAMHSLVRWRAMKQRKDLPWRGWNILFGLAALDEILTRPEKGLSRWHLFPKLAKPQQSDRDEIYMQFENSAFVRDTTFKIDLMTERFTEGAAQLRLRARVKQRLESRRLEEDMRTHCKE